MASIYPMQLLLVIAGFILRLAFPLAASPTITTTSSQGEIKCDTCTPVVLPPPPPSPPVVIECPPPPAPPSYPPPLPPASPMCPACPPCSLCPPPCPGCPPPPCNVCQVPSTSGPPPPQFVGGGVYSPPNGAVPYFPPPPYHWAGCSRHLELKLFVPIVLLLLSATFSFF
ncbi:hypothetical protein Godav_006485 [Gossypium davidsonii]|uniref:Leucine-rich repeat extensin-like protein 3 n=2 Tax=Gossypium TaxID=3633 RepID=A0A7J8S3Y4_GOSDV|nr:hypothetical protein [Gossypium davidsonii]MBA0656245.1 hypothetical protein [Gossypium klotzschianum]